MRFTFSEMRFCEMRFMFSEMRFCGMGFCKCSAADNFEHCGVLGIGKVTRVTMRRTCVKLIIQ